MERGLGIANRFRSGNQLVRSIHGGTIKAEVTDVVALIKQDIEESRKRGIRIRIIPNLHWEKIRRSIMLLGLLRRA